MSWFRRRIYNSLFFRVAPPVVAIVGLVGLALYAFVLGTLDKFQHDRIQAQLKGHSRIIYDIADRHYSGLLFNDSADRRRRSLIQMARALDEIERYGREQSIGLLVMERSRTVLTHELPADPTDMLLDHNAGETFYQVANESGNFYVYHMDFEPWDWHVMIVENEAMYSELLNDIISAYLKTFAILLAGTLIMLLYLRATLKSPINHIIASILRRQPPDYTGIQEFEFLGRTIHEMMVTIEEKNATLAKFLETVGAIIVVVDTEGHVVMFNRVAEKLLGYAEKEVLGLPYWEVLLVGGNRENGLQMLRDVLVSGATSFEMPVRTKTGEQLDVLWNNAALELPEGKGTLIMGTGIDITKRKMAERRLTTSLSEKEVLLKEIHHRVKNNLQIISSLLSLQSRYAKDDESFLMFKESRDRIRSMALLHERLYQSENLADVDCNHYIGTLVREIFNSYRTPEHEIRLGVDIEPGMHLSVDSLIPCGLIVNELLSNALKYAFPEGRAGEIHISLARIPADTEDDAPRNAYRLVVRDNGRGIPENMDLEKTDTLGLRIVRTLLYQIEGRLQYDGSKGAAFTITFSETGDSEEF